MREKLEALGAQTVAVSTIRIAPPEDPAPLARALASVEDYDWVVFTSGNGVRGADPEKLRAARIAVVGTATAAVLVAVGLGAELIPTRHTADELVLELQRRESLSGKRLLLLRSDIASPELPKALRAAGAVAHDVVAYRTLPETDGAVLREQLAIGVDLVLFTSGSTVRNYVALLGPEGASHFENPPRYATIGPVTSGVARELGLLVEFEANPYTVDGLVDVIARSGGR